MFTSRPARPVADILGDPLIKLMMRADGVDPLALAVELELVSARLSLAEPPAPLWPSACAGRMPSRVQGLCCA